MTYYLNYSGRSGVSAYELGSDYIVVRFSTGAMYEYNYSHTGMYHVENMKRLARGGYGLNSYINTKVRYNYSRKIR